MGQLVTDKALSSRVSRRRVLQGAAVIGSVWVPPVVESFTTPAAAGSMLGCCTCIREPSPLPFGYALVPTAGACAAYCASLTGLGPFFYKQGWFVFFCGPSVYLDLKPPRGHEPGCQSSGGYTSDPSYGGQAPVGWLGKSCGSWAAGTVVSGPGGYLIGGDGGVLAPDGTLCIQGNVCLSEGEPFLECQ
jgi:hypothetical protein